MNTETTLTAPVTINDLHSMKQRGEKISCLTAYDASFSAIIDSSGIDIMLVGDTLGITMQGHLTTVPVTLNDMIYHSQCVSRVRQRAFIIADLPFMTYATLEMAALNAAKLMQQGGAHMVKLEGGKPEIIKFLVAQGIPVCAHLGLLPQHIHQIGRYRVQGKQNLQAEQLVNDALAVQQAGAQLLILECIPAPLAAKITQHLTIPTIGIGAGINCDGQVLVLQDMLNISAGKRAKFSKNFMQEAASIQAAISAYHDAVKQGLFPTLEHSY